MDKAQELYDVKMLCYTSFYEREPVVEHLKGRLTTFFRECIEAWAEVLESRVPVLQQKPGDLGLRRGQRKLPRIPLLLPSMTETALWLC